MENQQKTPITVAISVNAPIEKVWDFWSKPEHITQWSFASADWHTPSSENDLRVGGKFNSRMEAKDGSMGFDFGGTYDEVKEHAFISYTLADDRKVEITFSSDGDTTKLIEKFDPESTNQVEMQQAGWQAILDNFRKYVESN